MSANEDQAGNAQHGDELLTHRKLVADARKFGEELSNHIACLAENGFNVDAEAHPGLNIVEHWVKFVRQEIVAMTETADVNRVCGKHQGIDHQDRRI